MGNSIATFSYDARGDIESSILNQQVQHIDYLIADYKRKFRPTVSDYSTFSCRHLQHETTGIITHKTDNYFFNPRNYTHYVIELKAGGDLAIKKAQAEKVALMREYFLLRNSLIGTNENVVIKFATAYNKFGEGNQWKQSSVRYFFADSFDAMTNDRIYKKGMAHIDAFIELERCSGTQFDPKIVKLFIQENKTEV